MRNTLVERYKILVRAYMLDNTEEGGLVKRAAFEECEWVLKNLLGICDAEIGNIYNAIYWEINGTGNTVRS